MTKLYVSYPKIKMLGVKIIKQFVSFGIKKTTVSSTL
jgi:hypothetical protein